MHNGIWLRLAVRRIGREMLLKLGAIAILVLSLAVALSQGSPAVHATLFTATDIDPGGYDWAGTSVAHSIAGTQQVGWGERVTWGMYIGALLWQSNTAGVCWEPLHSNEFFNTKAYGTSGGEQVGVGFTGNHDHALLWHGTAASVVDLNPGGFSDSTAYGTSGREQVGYGFGPATGDQHHALLWRGSAGSVVDLHPGGFLFSEARSVSGGEQVGYGFGPATGDQHHALLWRGSAGSVVDLHPRGFTYSHAFGTSGEYEVGSGSGPATGNRTHALLWHGSASAVVDLHPRGFLFSEAHGTFGSEQVGFGIPANENATHALWWRGSADSVVDLHTVLPSGTSFSHSWATGTDAMGGIVGFAFIYHSAAQHAIMWSRNAPPPRTSRSLIPCSVRMK